MIIACPACSTRYAVPDNAIGVDGRTVRCAKCRHSWYQEGPTMEMPAGTGRASSNDAGQSAGQDAANAPYNDGSAAAAAASAAATASPTAEPAAATAADATRYPQDEPSTATPVGASAAAVGRGAYHDSDAAVPDAPGYSAASHAGSGISEDIDDGVEGRQVHRRDRGAEVNSQFDHAPPFKPRRNPLKFWTGAAAVFAVLAFGTIAAVSYIGLPEWVPVERPDFGPSQPDLVLEFPEDKQDLRTLPNGTEFFGVSGTITNTGRETRSVPLIVIKLRDERERVVQNWVVTPPKTSLAPGETIAVNEAVLDVPRSAAAAEIGWKAD